MKDDRTDKEIQLGLVPRRVHVELTSWPDFRTRKAGFPHWSDSTIHHQGLVVRAHQDRKAESNALPMPRLMLRRTDLAEPIPA